MTLILIGGAAVIVLYLIGGISQVSADALRPAWIVLLLLLLLASGVFWLVMLVDCLKSSRGDKVVCVLLHLFLFILGAILYFFMAYGSADGQRK
jgi:hypothetical protein